MTDLGAIRYCLKAGTAWQPGWVAARSSPMLAASSCRKVPAWAGRQAGQALLEGAVVLLSALSLWVGIAWLARFQDMALQTSHASRFAAFSLARDPDYSSISAIRESYFSGPSHQWKDRRGNEILSTGRSEIALEIGREARLPADAQPGAAHVGAARLRQEWRIEDAGIVSATVKVGAQGWRAQGQHAASPVQASNSSILGLSQFDSYPAPLVRHTAILLGAGHASSDRETQVRIAQSELGWGVAANVSYELGRTISSSMKTVDGAWRRPEPVFDWLEPWHEVVPEHHLR